VQNYEISAKYQQKGKKIIHAFAHFYWNLIPAVSSNSVLWGHGDRHLTRFNQQFNGSSACPCDPFANTQNFTAFETARQYGKYLAVAPSEHLSGTSVQWRRRPSPHADLQAKADLSMAALHAIELSAEMRLLYERKLGSRSKEKTCRKRH